MRLVRAVIVGTITGLLLAPSIALAALVDDPNDADGKIDIAQLRVVRKPSGDVVFTVTLHHRLSSRVLLRNTNGITTLIDLDGDAAVDLMGGVRAFRGELDRSKIFVTWSSSPTGDRTVRRPDLKTFRWRVPGAFEVFPPGAFNIAALSSYFRAGRTCDPTCYDFAPDFGNWLTVN
jgi:hypothetical protein